MYKDTIKGNKNNHGISSCREIHSPIKLRRLMMNKMFSYTTHDEHRQSMVHPPMGLSWPDTHMGAILLTESSEDLLCCRAERPYDREIEWGKVNAVGKASLNMLCTHASITKWRASTACCPQERARDTPTRSMQQCRSLCQENKRMYAGSISSEPRSEARASSRSNLKWCLSHICSNNYNWREFERR